MKKRILIAGMFPFLCAGKVFCVDAKDLFAHASKHHRCLLDGKNVGYACPPCSDDVLFVLEETDTDRKDQEVTVEMDCEYYFAGCRICEKFMHRNNRIIDREVRRTESTLCDNDEFIKGLKESYEKKLKKFIEEKFNEEEFKELCEEEFEKRYKEE